MGTFTSCVRLVMLKFHWIILSMLGAQMDMCGVSFYGLSDLFLLNLFFLFLARCSVTTFILSTADVRTCIGCTRKAFLPVSMHKSSVKMELRGWFVEELLEAVHRCLFCGNAFVSVL